MKSRSIAAVLLILVATVGFVVTVAERVSWALSTTTTMAPTTDVKGTVYALNSAGERVPISGGLVEARHRSTGQLVSSTQTQANGTFNLSLIPSDYNVTVSALPPASNISPAFIVGQALTYITPSVVDSVSEVNVTLGPEFPERDIGGSSLTDSDGFFNVTVWPYYPLKSHSTTVHVSESTTTSIDVDLEPLVSAQLQPSIFYITFTHPEYPVGPEYPVDHVLKILPGHSYDFEGYMNTWPTVTTTVVFEGNQYTIGVNGYSYSSQIAWSLRFDAERRLFNFTMGEPYLRGREVAEFVVLIPKSLLDGSPIVFLDNVMVPSIVAQNTSHYFVRFRYVLGHNETVTHNVMVGGSNTVPENISPLVSLVITVWCLYLFSRRRNNEH